jgi:hypothetical protein
MCTATLLGETLAGRTTTKQVKPAIAETGQLAQVPSVGFHSVNDVTSVIDVVVVGLNCCWVIVECQPYIEARPQQAQRHSSGATKRLDGRKGRGVFCSR